jgi:hypothetical protein
MPFYEAGFLWKIRASLVHQVRDIVPAPSRIIDGILAALHADHPRPAFARPPPEEWTARLPRNNIGLLREIFVIGAARGAVDRDGVLKGWLRTARNVLRRDERFPIVRGQPLPSRPRGVPR